MRNFQKVRSCRRPSQESYFSIPKFNLKDNTVVQLGLIRFQKNQEILGSSHTLIDIKKAQRIVNIHCKVK